MGRPRGDSPIKRTGVLIRNFEKKRLIKRYQDPGVWVWLEIVSPLRGTNSGTKLKIRS